MTKRTAWDWCAKYIKLRDAIKDHLDSDCRYVRCRTCGKILERGTEDCQAGHFQSRGIGGSSGVYWAEENIHSQCSAENRFNQGSPKEMEDYIIAEYGQETVDRLRFMHKAHSYKKADISILGEQYKQAYKELLKKHNLKE
jgi:hypothetical protein